MASLNAPGAYPATPLNEEPSNLQHEGEPTQATPRSLNQGSDKPGFMTGAYSRVGETQPRGSTQNANYTYDDIASQSPYGQDTRPPNPATTLTSNEPATTTLASKEPANTPAENTAINSINKTSPSPHSHGVDHNKISSGLRGSAHTGNDEPYWGDIPYGTGVYNGVTGHGSNESTAQGSHHDQHDTATNTGIYNGVTGHGSKRSTSPGSSKYDEGITTADSTHQQRAFPLANNGSTTTTATTKPNDANEHKRDSRFIEGFAGAGATAAGGYAAHKHLNKDNDDSARATDEKLRGETSTQLGQNTPDVLSQPRSHRGEETLNRYEGREQSLPHRPFVAAPALDNTHEKALDRPLDTETVNKQHKKDDSDFAMSGATAAFASAYGADKYAHRDITKEHSHKPENTLSQNTTREPIRSDVQPLYTENENKHQKKEDSNLAKYGTAAAVAGAGAYDADKYANRDHTKETSPVTVNTTSRSIAREPVRDDAQVAGGNSSAQPHYTSLLADSAPAGIAATGAHQPKDISHSAVSQSERQNTTSPSTAREPIQDDAQVVGDNSHAQPHYNMLADGTPSGIAATSTHQPENVSRSAASQSERHNVPADRTSTTETQSTGRASSDSSHGGLYNVLSSGTPSGINLEHARAEKEHRHSQEFKPQQTSRFLSNAPTPPSTSRTVAAERNPAPELGNSAQYPAKQAANTVPEQLPSAGNEISTGSAFTSGQKMTHKCTSCGNEDDISHYMRI